MDGLGLLNTVTTFQPQKTTAQVRAISIEGGEEVIGYEIHMGQTETVGSCRPLFQVIERCGKPVKDFDGISSEDGRVWGTYLHGLFDASAFRRRVLNRLRERRGWPPLDPVNYFRLEESLQSLATLIRKHANLSILEQILNGAS